MKPHQTAYIIARGAQMRNSLEVLLNSIGDLEVVCKTTELAEALSYCSEKSPALGIYAYEDVPGVLQNLRELKRALPDSRIIVLVEEEAQCWQVEAFGAICLPNGTLAARLVEVIEDLVMAV